MYMYLALNVFIYNIRGINLIRDFFAQIEIYSQLFERASM